MNRARFVALRALPALLLAVVSACGGGGDSGGPSAPPPDNSIARIEISPSAAVTLVSGTTGTLNAGALTKDNRLVSVSSFIWASSNDAVVSVSGGVITGRLAGSATITASSGSVVSPGVTVTVSAGAAARLVVRAQPEGAASGTPLTAQPVIEVRDVAGNLVTTAAVPVTAALPQGGGVLSGATTVNSVQGIAQFANLTVAGTVGPRTLVFSSAGLTAVTSAAFTLRAGAPAAVAATVPALTLRSGIANPVSFVAQVRDVAGNDVALAGRTVQIAVQGGTGSTTVSGNSSITDAQGRATFTTLVVAGVAGARQLTLTADGLPGTATIPLSLVGGRPTRLRIERDLPSTASIGVPIPQQPVLQLLDSLGNTAPQQDVTVNAAVLSGLGTLLGSVATSDTTGRVTFSSLTFNGGTAGQRSIQFSGSGLTSATSRLVDVTIDVSRVTSVSVSKTSADTVERMFHMRGPLDTLTPSVRIRNAVGQLQSGGVRWIVRDPTRLTVDGNGRLSAVRAGRTFVVVQSATDSTIADSLLVFVPQNTTGPILRTDLKSYRLNHLPSRFQMSVIVESRDVRRFAGADISVIGAPDNNPFAPVFFADVVRLPDVTAGFVAGISLENRIVALWTPPSVRSSATVVLLTIVCDQRGPGPEQIILLLNQLLDGNYSDITSATSVFNPVLVAR